MPGTWSPLGNQPPVAIDTMLLLTDGSVMCHDYGAGGAYTPTGTGWCRTPSWITPTARWHKLTPMPANAPLAQNGPVDAPLYFASAVLRDGRVFVAGGEYNASPNVDILAARSSIRWPIPGPASRRRRAGRNIGDAPSCVLPDGRVLLGNINTVQTAILDPVTRAGAPAATSTTTVPRKAGRCCPTARSSWRRSNNHPQAEKYLIATNQWIHAGSDAARPRSCVERARRLDRDRAGHPDAGWPRVLYRCHRAYRAVPAAAAADPCRAPGSQARISRSPAGT